MVFSFFPAFLKFLVVSFGFAADFLFAAKNFPLRFLHVCKYFAVFFYFCITCFLDMRLFAIYCSFYCGCRSIDSRILCCFFVYWCCSVLSFFLSAVSATCSMRFCFLFVCDCPGLDPFYLFLVSFVNVSKVWFKFTLVLVFPYWFLLNRFFHPPLWMYLVSFVECLIDFSIALFLSAKVFGCL